MKQSSGTSVKSATCAVDILEFVAAAESTPTFGDTALALSIPNSSLFYLLNTLTQRGYLLQDGERGGYKLGGAVAALAKRENRAPSWPQRALSLLDQLTTALNETSTYAERRGDEVGCVATKLATQTLIPVLRAGQRAPLYVFSGGKILLADMPDDVIEAYFSRTRFDRLTPRTINHRKPLWRELREIRSSGVAYSRDEHTMDVAGVSVALRVGSQLVGRFASETQQPSPRSEVPTRRAR